MPHWLFHALFAFVLGGWCLLLGIGIGADVARWLKRRQKPGKGVAKALRRAH
jgi:hypothetical protein